MTDRDDGMLISNLHDDRKRHERELAISQNLRDWLLAATRFLVLANAGAAAATLAFIGAVLGSSLGKSDIEVTIPATALYALLLFIAGVGMAGYVILGQLDKSWQEWIEDQYGPVTVKHSSWIGQLTNAMLRGLNAYHSPLLFFSFTAFVVGGVLGVIALC